MRTFHLREPLTHARAGGVIRTPEVVALEETLTPLMGVRGARRLLDGVGTVAPVAMSAAEIAAVAQVPLKVAERVVAAREFGAALHPGPSPKFTASSTVIRHLPPGFATAETEFILAFALDAKMGLKAVLVIAKGGSTGASLAMRDVFVPLVRVAAIAFVLAHNHPSGDPTPSTEDVELTNRVARAGKTIDIELVDHLVVGRSGITSFRDTMLMPFGAELDSDDAVRHGGRNAAP